MRPTVEDREEAYFHILPTATLCARFSKNDAGCRARRPLLALSLWNTLTPLGFGGSGYKMVCSLFLST
jgi:hypothetical protein